MLNARRVTVITAISAVSGLLLGIFAASWYWLDFSANFTTSSLLLRTQADLITRISVLEHLRAGHAGNATRLLESLLDGDLIGAGALARDGHQFNANARLAVALELRLRRLSGYEPSDANVRAAVDEALSLLSVEP